MKIAFLNVYSGVIERGAETFVKELASRLASKHEIFVFQSGVARGDELYIVKTIPTEIDLSKVRNIKTIQGRLFLDYRSRRKALFTLKLLPALLRDKFDIVVPINGGWQPALARIATWLSRGKMVISGHSGMGWDDRNNLWCFPDIFIALSSEAKKWAQKVNPFVKSVRIPNGVDTRKFNSEGPKLKTNLGKPIILCVAALTESKRIDLTIKAVAKMGNASLLVVGGGDLRGEIKTLGERLLPKRFQLIKVPYQDIPKVYRVADVFTLPSEAFHSFEIVLVEAMAAGLPVVANNDPIREEIVGDAGILVDPAKTDEYADAIKSALEKNWGDISRKQAEKFNWGAIASDYEKLFSTLLK
ncbi:MAG: glycosyltransferase family 4 protein [Patescibacteria group bacterium]